MLMERCSPDEMEAMAATAPVAGGGPLAPFFLGLGAAMEEPLPSWWLPRERQNS